MLALVMGVVAVLAGVLLGYWLGRNSVQAESRLLREPPRRRRSGKACARREAKRLQEAVTDLTGQLRAAESQIAAERDKYAQMQVDIEKAFGDLAAKALSANNQSFLTLAKQELGGQNIVAKQTLEAKEQAIKNLLDPLGAALKSLHEQAPPDGSTAFRCVRQSGDAG